MTDEQLTLLIIRGELAGMPEVDRKGIELAAQKLREVVTTHNDHGCLALALVAAELAAKD